MKRYRAIATLLLTMLLLSPVAAAGDDPEAALSGVIRKIMSGIDESPGQRVAGELLFMPVELGAFYRERDFRPAWKIHTVSGREQARTFLAELQTINDEGLCAGDYHHGYFKTLYSDLSIHPDSELFSAPRWRGWDDVLLTDALMHYFKHLIEGRVPPSNVQEGWNLRKKQVELVDMVSVALDEERMAEVMQRLQPAHAGYHQLLKSLSWYRELTEKGGWPKIPPGPALHPDEPDPRLPLLRIRLLLSKDLQELPLNVPPKMLPGDVAALKRFQKRHGLKDDGVLGDQTLAALNVPVAVRLRQIELNLERWRWLPEHLGSRYILVNIADFRVSVVEDGKTVLSLPAVVGNRYRKTPVFAAAMRYLEFAPYWTVPATILYEDKLPLIRKDPGYLERHHFELLVGGKPVDPFEIDWGQVSEDEGNFPARLRQKPGPWNALGRIKFMFPNEYAVYLHDTPDRHLFWQQSRSFSSGCIRVQKPQLLAEYLLKDQGWARSDIRDAMYDERPQRVDLKRSVPVYVLYWTAWVDEEGLLHFRDDVYGRDIDLDLALRRELSTCRISSVALVAPPADEEERGGH